MENILNDLVLVTEIVVNAETIKAKPENVGKDSFKVDALTVKVKSSEVAPFGVETYSFTKDGSAMVDIFGLPRSGSNKGVEWFQTDRSSLSLQMVKDILKTANSPAE